MPKKRTKQREEEVIAITDSPILVSDDSDSEVIDVDGLTSLSTLPQTNTYPPKYAAVVADLEKTFHTDGFSLASFLDKHKDTLKAAELQPKTFQPKHREHFSGNWMTSDGVQSVLQFLNRLESRVDSTRRAAGNAVSDRLPLRAFADMVGQQPGVPTWERMVKRSLFKTNTDTYPPALISVSTERNNGDDMGTHWTTHLFIDLNAQSRIPQLWSFNSMDGHWSNILKNNINFIAEHTAKNKGEFCVRQAIVGQQKDGYSCGYFSALYSMIIARNLETKNFSFQMMQSQVRSESAKVMAGGRFNLFKCLTHIFMMTPTTLNWKFLDQDVQPQTSGMEEFVHQNIGK